jgi:hypothetical protein
MWKQRNKLKLDDTLTERKQQLDQAAAAPVTDFI